MWFFYYINKHSRTRWLKDVNNIRRTAQNIKSMNRYDLSKESNDGIGKAIGACVGTVVAILAKEALDKWLGDDK